MAVSEPGGGVALEVGSVLCVSGRGTTWSTVTTQATDNKTNVPNFILRLCLHGLFIGKARQ